MPNITFLPFPELAGDRLHLRRLTARDEEAILHLRDHEEVIKYIDRPKVASLAGAEDFIRFINRGINKERWFYWGIALSNRQEVIGTICLWNFNGRYTRAELGYELHPDFQGQGLMREAVKTVLHFGFHTLGLRQVRAYTHVENVRSVRLLEKVGFSFLKMAEEFSVHQLKNSRR